ncbi:hypothetical protein WJX74_001510 [Apatococcus lobatus]|uniref:Ricin B lectin domain-containing protein n=1 Tax=Apatococcus lobatus TaxID=904363 RepID=A0AAW1RBD6_9CHLO
MGAASIFASSVRNPSILSHTEEPSDIVAIRGRRLLEAADDPSGSFPAEETLQQGSRRALLGLPFGAPIYLTRLVPKYTISQGLLALDGKAGVGTQTVLNNLTTQNTQLLTVQTTGEVQLSNLSNGQKVCLDVRAAQYADGVPVLTWPCNGGNNQKWNFVAKENAYYSISPVDNAKYCLDVRAFGTAANTPIEIWSCNGGTNQAWTLVSAG